jgi:pimeloyl-ACP methyl ester carboxylesterase
MIFGSAVMVVTTLWLYGRFTRTTWYDEVSIHPIQTSRQDPQKLDDAVFTITGAFCGPAHLDRLEREWSKQATVYRVWYPIDIFSMRKAVDEVYRAIRFSESELRHQRFYILGYSLGGLIGLLVWMKAMRCDPEFAKTKLRLVVHDSPLGFQHLLIPGGLAVPKKVRRAWMWLGANLWWMVRPGPLLNWVARPFMHLAFPYVPDERLDAEADQQQIREHRQFLARNRASLMVAKIAAIGRKRELFGDEEMPVVFVRSGLDEVVAGDEAVTGWKLLFPMLHVIQLPANTGHITAPENHNAYKEASNAAFDWLLKCEQKM